MNVYPFQIGELRCTVVSDGQPRPPWEPEWHEFFGPDTGVNDRELTAALIEDGEQRRSITLGYNCLTIHTPAGVVLVDAGLGESFPDYGPAVANQVGKLRSGLLQAGIQADDISTVILTHLHKDHVRGAIRRDEPTFPNAEHVLTNAEAACWSRSVGHPELADHAEVATSALGILTHQLRCIDPDTTILPSVRGVDAAGHTPGHMAVMIRSGGERLLCLGDSFYDRIQLRRPAWWTHYDLEPRQSVESRVRLLTWAAEEQLVVHAYHMPFPGLGRIERRGPAFVWKGVTETDGYKNLDSGFRHL